MTVFCFRSDAGALQKIHAFSFVDGGSEKRGRMIGRRDDEERRSLLFFYRGRCFTMVCLLFRGMRGLKDENGR